MNTEPVMRRKCGVREQLSDFGPGAKRTGNMDLSLPGLAENGARQSARSSTPQIGSEITSSERSTP